MIHTEKCFVITCDNCNETYQNDHSGFSLFVDENSATEDAEGDNWHIGEDNHYCPKCYTINDDDELIIKPLPPAPASIIKK